MKVILDQQALQRRQRAAHAASLGGLLAVLASVALNLWRPGWATVSAALLLVGFAVASVGIYQANRWVKKPRPEEVLDHALKGLDDRCRLYHYLPHAPQHLLLMPMGVIVLETRAGEGIFEYRRGKWHQRITLGKALRFFLEEPLGDPITDAQQAAARVSQVLEAKMPDGSLVPAHAVVVFTHPAVSISAQSPAIPVCQPKQLRSLLPKGREPMPQDTYDRLRSLLDDGSAFG